ncbi:MAG: zinc ribbon domain-containing protein, partial [Desulfobulbaceae bacterium]|nr:zinc ribbon domain-containing protein [Desulfobulbaceae bacterium]
EKKMPIYEYLCQDCHNKFETIVLSAKNVTDVTCSKCGSKNVKKTISASSYRLSTGASSLPTASLGSCASKSGFS